MRERLAQPDSIRPEAFGILRSLCSLINNEPAGVGEVDPKVQELVLRALEHRDAFGPAVVILDGLVRRVGLFPYLDPEDLGLADTVAYEYHRPTNMLADGVIFHRAQGEVYRSLLDGENVILSAPTSFGKSLIIDAIIATGKFKHVAIVVPTIALIDETRRRLARRFGRQYKIITHPSQERGTPELLVMTQERMLDVKPLGPIDFLVIDEFYKLQPRQEDTDRSLVLNEAFYRLHKTGAQFYLLGPNIDSIGNLPSRITCRFIKTDYKTVVSQLHRVDPGDDDVERLVQLCKDLHDPTLIFCRSPQRVRDVTNALLQGGLGVAQPNLSDAVAWIGEQYHPDWLFARALGQGIGMHHGQLPRTLSQFVVKAFNDGNVRFLVCTSTLIEGVNTKAKNVVVLDNKIAKRKYDFFTYNNIAGRSGRMFEHFVGNVYVFRDPPAENLPLIDVPIFTQPDDAPESLLIQIDEQDLGAAARERVGDLLHRDDLDVEVLKESRGVDPRALVRLAQAMREHLRDWATLLSWTGQPTNPQLQLVCKLIWDYLVPGKQMRAGVSSGAQLSFRIERLRHNGGGAGLLRAAIQESAEPGEVVESAIEFLRFWANFNFPKYLLAVDRVQRSVLTKAGRAPGNYAYFAGLVENWFLDPAVVALDEYGIPIQVGERLQGVLRPEGSLDVALARLRALDVDALTLSAFEKDLVRDAIAHL
jgi:hypothetical protein